MGIVGSEEESMSERTKDLERQVLELSPAERLELVDEILASLDRPDEFVNALWYREAEDRLAAYRRGEIKTVSVEEVIAKHRSR
jgi:putative addiction module component (TIGR02574 family)